MKPGLFSSHSAKVRIGIDVFSRLPGLVVLNGRLSPLSLYRRSSRSIVDALTLFNCSRTSSDTVSSPCSTSLSVNSATKGAKRLPHRRSEASQTAQRASLSSGPYTGGLPRLVADLVGLVPDSTLTADFRW